MAKTLVVLLAGACAASLAPAATATETALARIRTNHEFVVAHRTDAVPFSYLDPATRAPIGYTVDLCREVVNRLVTALKLGTVKTRYVLASLTERFALLDSGRADLECGASINNAERRETLAFSMPILFSGPRILTRVDTRIGSFADLYGRRIGVLKGSNAAPILQKRYADGMLGQAEIVELPNNDVALAQLTKRQVDAVITGEVSLHGMRSRATKPQDFVVTGPFLLVEALGIVMRKGDNELRDEVNKVLSAMMLDGTVKRLYERWFLAAIPPSNAVLDLPMSELMRDQLRWPSINTGDEWYSRGTASAR